MKFYSIFQKSFFDVRARKIERMADFFRFYDHFIAEDSVSLILLGNCEVVHNKVLLRYNITGELIEEKY